MKLAESVEGLGAAQTHRAVGPLPDIGQDQGFFFGCQGGEVDVRAKPPCMVHAAEHGRCHEGCHGLNKRAGLLKQARCRLNRSPHLRLYWQATASVHQQADTQAAQASHALVELAPGNGLVRQAHAVAGIRQAQYLHHQRGISHCAGHGAGRTAGVGRVNRHPAQTGLEAENTAPAGRQAQRATNVGAQVQRTITGGGSRTCAGTAAPRGFAQVPGIAGERMEGGQARGQHAVVGHGGFTHQHRTGLAQALCCWCIACGRYQLGGCGTQRCGVALRGDVVLDGDRHPVERPKRAIALPAGRTGARLSQCQFGPQQVAGMQHRLPALDVIQHRLRHLQR